MRMKLNNFVKNYPCILITFFPLAMVIGPAIAEIIMNLLSIMFIYNVIRNKDYTLFKSNFVKFFLIFYFLISVSTIFLYVNTEQLYKVFAHLRFLFFALAICYFLQENKKFITTIFYFSSGILLLTSIDGIYQYINGENFFGYVKYRPDRISGVFNDDLILGSFLSKFLPAILSFYFFIYKKKGLLNISYLLLILITTIFTIFISGERSSMLFILIFCFLSFISLNIKIIYKLITFFVISCIIFITLISNPVLLDRYYNQTIKHVFGQNVYKKQVIPEYYPLFATSLKMFEDNILFGQGFRSFRYKCNEEKFITYGQKYTVINNEVLTFDISWKILNVEVIKLFIKNGDFINLGDEILEYKILRGNNKGKIQTFKANKIGIIKNLSIGKGTYIGSGHGISKLDISDLNIKKTAQKKKIGCDTHPHNYYFQLLSETGIVGFLSITTLFIFFVLQLSKFLLKKIISRKVIKNESEIILIIFFISYLWPISFSGNFFNNWLSMSLFYSIGLYFFYTRNDQRN